MLRRHIRVSLRQSSGRRWEMRLALDYNQVSVSTGAQSHEMLSLSTTLRLKKLSQQRMSTSGPALW
jgi:hypothetical protein